MLLLDDATLARARAFARAGHAALDVRPPGRSRQRRCLGGAAPGPRARRRGARADEAQRARLGEGIAALHAAGGAHGCIDSQHLYLHDGELTLAYPREAPGDVEELAARDLAALQELDRNALDEL